LTATSKLYLGGVSKQSEEKMARSKKANKTALALSVIEELRRKGYNQSEIAEMHGVSRQAVSWHKIVYGGFMTTRQIVNKAWPWKTTVPHSKASAYQRLRDLGEYQATGGHGMSEDKLKRLKSWLNFMRDNNFVLEFDPELPPEPGVSPYGGFAYRKRKASDGDLLIRVNKHTEMSEEGHMIWCFPPRDPKV
jgi:hypothetical protein